MKVKKVRGIKKLTSGMLTLIFLLTMVFGAIPVASASSALSDVGNNWAAATINEFVSQGIIKGYPDGTFRPDNSITRAEFITVINKSFGYTEKAVTDYTDVKATDWFAEDIAKAKAAGYIKGYDDGTMQPNAKISRQEAFTIIALILKLDTATYDASLLNGFKDNSKIATWSRNYVSAAVKDGIVAGYPDQTFRPTNPISRAEAVHVIKKAKAKVTVPDPDPVITPGTFDKAGTYGPASAANPETISGNATISASGVTLQNIIINGNLTITEAVGDGDVTLKNVTVKGTTFIYGGGENTVEVTDSTLGKVIIKKVNNQIRVIVTGKTTVDEVEVISGGTLEEASLLTGRGFGVIHITAPDGTTIILKGRFETVEVQTPGLTINVPKGSSVSSLIMNQTGTITGIGSVRELTANANGIRYEGTPESITVNLVVTVRPVKIGGGGGGGGGGGTTTTGPTISSPKIMSGSMPDITTVNGVISGKNITFTLDPGTDYDNASVTLSEDVYVTVKNEAGDTLADAILVDGGTLTATPAVRELFGRYYMSRMGTELIAKSPLTVELKSKANNSKTTYTVIFVGVRD